MLARGLRRDARAGGKLPGGQSHSTQQSAEHRRACWLTDQRRDRCHVWFDAHNSSLLELLLPYVSLYLTIACQSFAHERNIPATQSG